jgi:Tol biopolymer transport system component
MSNRVRRALALACLGLVVGAVVPAVSTATFPGPNGRITFMRFDANGEFQVWVANPDLSHQVQLTHGPGSDAWFPTWSTDGSRIAFSSHRSDPDPADDVEISDAYTMRADGTDVRKVTDSQGFSGNPSWSPDGRWLVYSTDRGGGGQHIEIIPSDGSGPSRRITSNPAGSLGQELARFSPNGKRIVFNEVRVVDGPDGPVEQGALFTVARDGSKLRRITPWEIYAADADWSPDGTRIVFSARLAENDFVQSVMVVDADGQHLRQLTRGDQARGEGAAFRYQESFNPAWSPDGTRIMFVRATFTEADGFAMGLQTMRPNGSGRVALSFGEEHQPDWGSVPAIP